jgi:hypothetical protein
MVGLSLLNRRFLVRNELRVEDELREMIAEGKRRQRAHEGLPELAKDEQGNTIGWLVDGKIVAVAVGRSSAELAKASRFWGAEVSPPFTHYECDDAGLERELSDLIRDVEKFEKSENVRFESRSLSGPRRSAMSDPVAIPKDIEEPNGYFRVDETVWVMDDSHGDKIESLRKSTSWRVHACLTVLQKISDEALQMIANGDLSIHIDASGPEVERSEVRL